MRLTPDAYRPALNTLLNVTCNFLTLVTLSYLSGSQHSALLQVLAGSGSEPHDPYSVLKLVALKGLRWIDNPSLHNLHTNNPDRLTASVSNRIDAHNRNEQNVMMLLPFQPTLRMGGA